ncbi:PDR/VanB family oxidoreductase [Nocardia sp. CA2R105]|uniref:PDR/VanB family oxidoreductase n=1 Tax=Nocardia coffeae TaxID=2873381 RepID=UPI001CA6E8E1|nr:PDR/VanB family oxidoreductase [Nocardia coffeae]MBY8863362.1 PDR/VanB family oxidoreductase [Nocardia coffeae]
MAKTPLLTARLNRIEYGAREINLYHFGSAHGDALPGAEPGAHIDVIINDTYTRQYSLINSGDVLDEYIIGVRCDLNGRGGSRALHETSVVGNLYTLSEPRNNFPLVADDGPVALLAGGIGITPLINMYRTLSRLGRPVDLYYWARTSDDFVFFTELESQSNVRLVETGDTPGGSLGIGEVVAATSPDAHLYCCGPSPMLDAFTAASADRAPERVHLERFSAVVSIGPRQPNEGFKVTLARSGTVLDVPVDQTILETCLAEGIDVDYSCEEGTCGACEVKVLSGAVSHCDAVKTPAEHDAGATMAICCSRARDGDLVLDI